MQKNNLNRELLYERHRLSHQQIDDFLEEKESRNYISEKLEQMALLHEFLLITDEFSSAGISFISLKGPLLSYRLYKDATYRRYKDFDFFMEIPAIEKAIGILGRLGYVSIDFNWPENKRRKQLIIEHDKHICMYHPNKGTCVELHWKLFDVRITQPEILSQLVLANQIKIEFHGREYLVFKPEFELVYLIIHGGLGSWCRLKWLIDIHQMMKVQPINQHEFIKISSLLHADRMVALYNSIITEFYPDDKKLPAKGKVLSLLRNFSLEAFHHLSGYEQYKIFGLAKSFRFNLMAFPGYCYKYDVIKRNLFYHQEIGNEYIPPYSIFYYIGGVTKRVFSRIKLTFKPVKHA